MPHNIFKNPTNSLKKQLHKKKTQLEYQTFEKKKFKQFFMRQFSQI
jgi:hypothetical protein